jgi:hypothetical protein
VRLAWILVVAACHPFQAFEVTLPPPTCTAAAEHVRTLLRPASARANRTRDVFAARCQADAWSDEVRACIVATRSVHEPRHCKAQLTADQRDALDHELAALPAAARVGWAPLACHEYHGLINALGTCDAMPAAMRAAFQQGYRELVQAWAGGTLDVPVLEAQCRQLASGLRHVASLTCGW